MKAVPAAPTPACKPRNRRSHHTANMDYGYGARFETGESVYALIPDAEITPPKPPMHVSKVRRACGRPRSACVREGDGVEGVTARVRSWSGAASSTHTPPHHRWPGLGRGARWAIAGRGWSTAGGAACGVMGRSIVQDGLCNVHTLGILGVGCAGVLAFIITQDLNPTGPAVDSARTRT